MQKKDKTAADKKGRQNNSKKRRICDEQCPECKKVDKSGLCKEPGDAYGNHSGRKHICNRCYYQW